MVHKLFLENSCSAAVNKLPNTIIYLKAIIWVSDQGYIQALTDLCLPAVKIQS